MKRVITIAVFASVLWGCPPPEPLTGPDCPVEETRKNCGLCASDPACAWCASSTSAQVGCHDRDRPIVCDGTVVRVLEGCDGFPEEQVTLEP